MSKLVRALGVLLVVFGIVVYARDCRMSFNQWRYCGSDLDKPGIVGSDVNFSWNWAGLFSDTLYVDGKPAARLAKYYFHLTDDAIVIAALDGSKKSRYCGK
jgi:hypothetical protein